MALKDTGKNILVNGITHSVFYDKGTGAVEVRTEVSGRAGQQTGGDAIYNNLNNGAVDGYNQTQIEATISANSDVVKQVTKGVNPGFLTDETINLSGGDGGLSQGVAEDFQNTEGKYGKDVFFDGKKSAQYPIDALYGRTNFVQTSGESQDHLVISQYKYKPPRADDIWGKTQPGVIITQGIARNSPLDEFLGLVKMPMPNAIQDSNNVAWGEDTVNALEAAALNTVQPKFADIAKSGATGGAAARGASEALRHGGMVATASSSSSSLLIFSSSIGIGLCCASPSLSLCSLACKGFWGDAPTLLF